MKVEQDDVVVVHLAEIDALFTEIRRVDAKAFGLEHQLDRSRGRAMIFNQQDAHASPFPRRVASSWHAAKAALGYAFGTF